MAAGLRRLIAALLLLVLLLLAVVVVLVANMPSELPNTPSPAAPTQGLARGASCTGTDARAGGQIAFGTGLDISSLTLSCVTSTFPLGSPFAWRAQFTQPVSAGTVSVLIARTYGGGSTEQTVLTQPQVVSAADTQSFGAQADPGLLARLGPGQYAMRLIAGNAVLAEGRFTVTP